MALSGVHARLARISALLGAARLAGFYLVLALAKPQARGLRDVKLAAVIGLVFGWYGNRTVAIGLAGASTAGAPLRSRICRRAG